TIACHWQPLAVCFFFFFQAEDGIRDRNVTGVQTCALPISTSFHRQTPNNQEGGTDDEEFRTIAVMDRVATTWSVLNGLTMNCVRSEERRVGKECRCRWSRGD